MARIRLGGVVPALQCIERRGDPRGKGGQLVPQPGGAIRLSPNDEKWEERGRETMENIGG